ncbi:MAG: metallophosphoesterase family protein [Anaerolineales bacterium]|nr:metallophosphoesterase family protein [Anaerolineales bacterium]
MQLAVLADLHGNLPALEAILADLQTEAVDGYLIAGDVSGGPHVLDCIRRLAPLRPWVVLGNNEEYLRRFDRGQAPAWWQTSRQWASTRWIYENLDRAGLDWVNALPEQVVIELPGCDPIRMFHGTPRSIFEHLYPGFGEEALQATLAATREPVLACGHSHVPWQVHRNGRLAFNPGAAGGIFEGPPGAQYALLRWESGRWEVDLRWAAYDLGLIRRAYHESGLLEAGGAFARAALLSIEIGRFVTLDFLAHLAALAGEADLQGCEYYPDHLWDHAAATFDWPQGGS